jgi:HTH-type transcriptional regulator/antitoxin HipB
MNPTPAQIGNLIKQTRDLSGLTQRDLALTSGTGLRFIIELEHGKPTCHLGKVLTVLDTLGITIKMSGSTIPDEPVS